MELPSGEVLNQHHTIESIFADETGRGFPWPQPPAARFGPLSADVLNRSPAVVFFLPPTHAGGLGGTGSSGSAPGGAGSASSSSSGGGAGGSSSSGGGSHSSSGGGSSGGGGSSAGGSAHGSAPTGPPPLVLAPAEADAVRTFEAFAQARSALAYRSSLAMRADEPAGALRCGIDSRSAGSMPPAFLYGAPDAISKQVMAWARITDPPPLVALIDFPTKVKYVMHLWTSSALTFEALNDFLVRYEEGLLQPASLR